MTTRAQLLFGIPAALGGVVAAAIGVAVLWPQWHQLQVGRLRLAELQGLATQIPLLTQQLQREQQRSVEARQQLDSVLQTIAGSGSLATFMAQADRLAARSGVTLSLYEPITASTPAAAATPNPGQKPATPAPATAADPLLAPGVAKQEVLLSASGRYPALLDFMRQLEKLTVLVVQSNLQLSSEDQAPATVSQEKLKPTQTPAQAPVVPQLPPVQLKMNVASYHRAPK